MRRALKMYSETPKEGDNLGDVGIDGENIPINLKKQDVAIWTGSE
jgi:hypothetical protein